MQSPVIAKNSPASRPRPSASAASAARPLRPDKARTQAHTAKTTDHTLLAGSLEHGTATANQGLWELQLLSLRIDSAWKCAILAHWPKQAL